MSTDTSRFFMTRAPRPMLARDADTVYWMSRYVERSEHIARVLLINTNLLMDVGELAPELPEVLPSDPASPLAPGDVPLAQRVAQHMTFNTDTPHSLFNCIGRARENA